ncbi:nucleoside hydrolase [Alkalinema sp. FACHB-956]|uniref:nucleoside hydrolase n=1 Tax=Alkalinema sp. FACHB-956 TaxID=2692768 RepID=UPI001683B54C|nr:nucleoside hydrolase [Alkalinema sp. FACHB-956]MBD2328533.1 nucleoside hydrolase [Alkalinema sp. FACHB-956]
MVPQPLIIDCDPGVDDAIALLLAFASPELQILGITTVAGNVPLQHTQTNARKICELAGMRQIPIFAGCPRAMLRSTLETAEYVHGATGLGQITLPEPQIPLQEQHGVDFLIATLLAAPEPITIATLGPLTNLAIALIKEPRIIPQIREVVMMGGAITHGNVTPSAEFNIYTDPHAAAVVLTAGLNLTLISLDVTHQAIATPERVSKIRELGDPIGSTVATLLTQYSSHDMGQYGFAGAPLHDPCVIAYLLRPDLFTARPCFVEIETQSAESLGRTIVDWYGVAGKAVNVNVVETIDSDGFYQLLTERLA